MLEEASGISVTISPYFNGKVLLVKRSLSDKHFPGYWAFPGGRVNSYETLTAAAIRECAEETNLKSAGKIFYVDSYLIGKRIGVHFCLEVENQNVLLDEKELISFAWVERLDDMKKLSPRIPGLDNHLMLIKKRLAELGTPFQAIADLEVLEPDFLNK